jgi:hypothetical protein
MRPHLTIGMVQEPSQPLGRAFGPRTIADRKVRHVFVFMSLSSNKSPRMAPSSWSFRLSRSSKALLRANAGSFTSWRTCRNCSGEACSRRLCSADACSFSFHLLRKVRIRRHEDCHDGSLSLGTSSSLPKSESGVLSFLVFNRTDEHLMKRGSDPQISQIPQITASRRASYSESVRSEPCDRVFRSICQRMTKRDSK